MRSNNIDVAIFCITYNHAKLIEQAFDSFLSQKTQYQFKIYVSDDASDDGTQDIIREYWEKYPDKFDIVLRRQNIGVCANFAETARRIHSKYVFMCEGDDYWIDVNKIQKQVTFFENNLDYSVCFHPALIHYEDASRPDKIFPTEEDLQGEISFETLVKKNVMLTSSVAYRWRYKEVCFPMLPSEMLPCDWFLHLAHAQVGKVGYLRDVMSVYRKWGGGVWNDVGGPNWALKYAKRHKLFYQAVTDNFGIKTEQQQKHLDKMYYAAYLTVHCPILYDGLRKIYTFYKRMQSLV